MATIILPKAMRILPLGLCVILLLPILCHAEGVQARLTKETDIPLVDAQGNSTGTTMKAGAGETVNVLNLDPNTGKATIVYGSTTLTVPLNHLDADAAKPPACRVLSRGAGVPLFSPE